MVVGQKKPEGYKIILRIQNRVIITTPLVLFSLLSNRSLHIIAVKDHVITTLAYVCPIRLRSNEARLLLGSKLVRIYLGKLSPQLRSILHVRHNIPSDPKSVPGRLQIGEIPKSSISNNFFSGIHSDGPVFSMSYRADSFRSYPGLGQVLIHVPFAFTKYDDAVLFYVTNNYSTSRWGYSLFHKTTQAISLICNPRHVQSLPSYAAGRLYTQNPRTLSLIIFKGRQLLLWLSKHLPRRATDAFW